MSGVRSMGPDCLSVSEWVRYILLTYLPDLPTWPTYLTYLSDLPTWPTYLQCVTRPNIWKIPIPRLFFDAKFFRDRFRDFFRYQILRKITFHVERFPDWIWNIILFKQRVPAKWRKIGCHVANLLNMDYFAPWTTSAENVTILMCDQYQYISFLNC